MVTAAPFLWGGRTASTWVLLSEGRQARTQHGERPGSADRKE